MQISFMGFYGGKNVFTFLNHGNPTFTSSYIPLPLLNDRDIDNCQTFEYYFSQRVILEQWYFRKRCVTRNDTTFHQKNSLNSFLLNVVLDKVLRPPAASITHVLHLSML